MCSWARQTVSYKSGMTWSRRSYQNRKLYPIGLRCYQSAGYMFSCKWVCQASEFASDMPSCVHCAASARQTVCYMIGMTWSRQGNQYRRLYPISLLFRVLGIGYMLSGKYSKSPTDLPICLHWAAAGRRTVCYLSEMIWTRQSYQYWRLYPRVIICY